MSPITRTLVILAFSLILINSATPVLAFDDKSQADASAMFEKVGEKERIYKLPFDEVWKLCNNAAVRAFEKVSADKDKATLEMDSGISLSMNAFHIVVNLEKVDDNRTRVKVSTQKKKRLSWGSGSRIAKEFFKAIDKQLIPDKGPENK